MRGTQPTRNALIGGWLCIAVGTLLPIFLIVVGVPQGVALAFPVAAVLLILGLFMVAGRFPSQRDPS